MSKIPHYVVFDKCIKTQQFLLEKGFTLLIDRVVDKEASEPLKIILNSEKKTFAWADSEGFVDFKRTLFKKNSKIITTTLKELKSCLN